jgi:phosphonate transport system substrate-binding protein
MGLVVIVALACSGDDAPVLRVGGIPDQDATRLARRYQVFAEYLSAKLDVEVEYVPSVDYSAVVTAFTQGGLDLAYFGGLTGVQARLRSPGAQAIAQRERDARFHSKFIAGADLPIDSMADLMDQAGGLTLTFGSESSTSGHLMPRHFLIGSGLDPDTDFKSVPNFSGSHDLTWKLVESGAFDLGALSEAVWQRAVDAGRVDLAKVKVFHTTPGYFDYQWTVSGGVDREFGDGFSRRIKRALLELDPQEHAEILQLFSARRFIETDNGNYDEIEAAARSQGIIQ